MRKEGGGREARGTGVSVPIALETLGDATSLKSLREARVPSGNLTLPKL